MSDKKHNIKDDEYHFPKDEYLDESMGEDTSVKAESSDDFTVPPRQSTLLERFPILKNKKIWGVSGLVIVLVVGMQMMHHRSDNKVIMKKPAVAAVPAVESKLASLHAAQASSMSEIQQLKQQVSQLQSTISASNNSNTQLSQSVVALAAQVKLLSKTVEQNTHDLTVRKVVKKGAVSKPIIYHIKAVIPGRAWLVSSTGNSNTVSVGDKINDYYGTVKLIDSDMGRIITSHDKVITYGHFDH
jgi:intracellular multiplication protein IcmG